MSRKHFTWALVLGCAFVAGCKAPRDPDTLYTVTGQPLGPKVFKEIPVQEGKVRFIGDNPVKKREAQALIDRYSERVTLTNNAVLTYSKLYTGGFTTAWGDEAMIKSDVGLPFYRDKGIVFDGSKVKQYGIYTYTVQSSQTHHCFLFRATFGYANNARPASRGGQSATGNICSQSGTKSAEVLEAEMLSMLARARYED